MERTTSELIDPDLWTPLPRFEGSVVAIEAPGEGPGNWAGASSAVLVDGVIWLAYRVRRPLGDGRGVATVVARSDDGVSVRDGCTSCGGRTSAPSRSSARPSCNVPTVAGGSMSAARLRSSKHWWIEAVDADTPEVLAAGARTVVMPGDDTEAFKDPVVVVDAPAGGCGSAGIRSTSPTPRTG